MNDLPLLTTPVDDLYIDLPDARFVAEHARRGHRHLARRLLEGGSVESVLPGDAEVLMTLDADTTHDVLAAVGDAVAHVELWGRDGQVTVSAASAAEANAVADAIKARGRSARSESQIEVRFTDAQSHDRVLTLDVLPWGDSSFLYPASVRKTLDTLMAYEPDHASGRRLILWYGEPGTGKTTAVRALLHAWRDWTDAVVISDPDLLLADGKYLRRVVLRESGEDKWQLFVLEDSDALLTKRTRGNAFSKLLNLADGLLGQGLKTMFLLTTNEPIGEVHPALSRPGRCLAQVEFARLSAAEASTLLGRPFAVSATLAQVMAERSISAESAPRAVGQYL